MKGNNQYLLSAATRRKYFLTTIKEADEIEESSERKVPRSNEIFHPYSMINSKAPEYLGKQNNCNNFDSHNNNNHNFSSSFPSEIELTVNNSSNLIEGNKLTPYISSIFPAKNFFNDIIGNNSSENIQNPQNQNGNVSSGYFDLKNKPNSFPFIQRDQSFSIFPNNKNLEAFNCFFEKKKYDNNNHIMQDDSKSDIKNSVNSQNSFKKSEDININDFSRVNNFLSATCPFCRKFFKKNLKRHLLENHLENIGIDILMDHTRKLAKSIRENGRNLDIAKNLVQQKMKGKLVDYNYLEWKEMMKKFYNLSMKDL